MLAVFRQRATLRAASALRRALHRAETGRNHANPTPPRVWSWNCYGRCMPLRFARALLVTAGAITVTATLASAQDADRAAPRVRGTTADAALLLDELVARSPTVRELVDRLDHSDLVVYIRYEWFLSATLRGRIGFLASDKHRRLFAIEIACRYTRTDQLVALGHELQHAVEIADAPSVWDVRSLAAFYTSIGESTAYAGRSETFETAAAAETGRRVRSELATMATPADIADIRN